VVVTAELMVAEQGQMVAVKEAETEGWMDHALTLAFFKK
jgi:hypothetical protein